MRTLKKLLVCSSAAAILACGVATAGEDNEAQAKARQASRDKVKEMENQPGPAGSGTISGTASTKPAKPAAQPTSAATEDKPVQHLVVPKAANEDAISKAREAARQKIEELEKSGVPAENVSTPATASKEKPAAPEPKPATKKQAAAPKEPTSPAKQVAKSPKASAPETTTTQAASSAQDAPAAPVAPKAPAEQKPKATAKSSASQLPELDRTPSPFDDSRQQRLAELLKRYRADELSPEQYHAERAKILKGE